MVINAVARAHQPQFSYCTPAPHHPPSPYPSYNLPPPGVSFDTTGGTLIPI